MAISFRLKMILGIALIETAALLLLVWLSLDYLRGSNQDALTKRAEATTQLLASMTKDSIITTDIARLESFVTEIMNIPEIVYVRIHDQSHVLAESGYDRGLSREFVEDTRFDNVNDGVFDTASDIVINNHTYGKIEIGMSVSELEKLIDDARNNLTAIALVEILLVGLFSLMLAIVMTRRLKKLSSAAIEISEGGLGTVVDISGKDEIYEVAEAFNTMSMEIKDAHSDLEEALKLSHRVSNNLIESELRMRAVMNTAVDGFVLIDEHGCIKDINLSAENIFGYEGGELLNKNIEIISVGNESGNINALIGEMDEDSLTGDKLGRLEVKGVKSDSEEFPVELTISGIDVQQKKHYVVVIRDLTEVKKVERQLKYNEALKTAVSQASLDGLVTINHEGIVIDFNDAAEDIYGYMRSEVVGNNIADIVIPEKLRNAHHEGMKKYIETGIGPVIGQRVQVPSIRRDGTEFPAELTVIPIDVENNMLFTAFIRDVTEQTKAEEELKQAKEQAEKANEAKSRFIASMSHEIRTPINAVLGTMDLISDTRMTDEQYKYVKTARKSGRALLSLVNNILDFSKIESGSMEMSISTVDIDKLVTGVIDILYPIAQDKDIEIVSFINISVPKKVDLDEAKLRQVLINLLTNAIKFTQQGGVGIYIDNEIVDNARYIKIVVEDTGIGLKEDEIPELFKEFSQVDNELSSDYDGTGLGLAISRRMIDIMGGEIGVESRYGEGSKFTIQLPVSSPVEESRLDMKPVNSSVCLELTSEIQLKFISQQCMALGLNIVHELDDCDVLIVDEKRPDIDQLLYRSTVVNLVLVSAHKANIYPDNVIQMIKPVSRCEIRQIIENDFMQGVDCKQQSSDNESNQLLECKGRILLVDDSEANQLVGCGMIKKLGYQVDIANDGLEAVDMVQANDYGLVLMDMRMPVMDGLQATEVIRGMKGALADINIVAMTANAIKEDLDKCLEIGMNDYLTKPVNRNELSEKITQWYKKVQGSSDSDKATGTNSNSTLDVAGLALVDASAFVQLAEDTSDELVPTMVELFLTESRQRVDRLRELDAEGDMESIGDEAHTLKSTSITFGALQLNAIAKQLESECRAHNCESINTLKPRLIQLAEDTFSWFENNYPNNI